MFSKSGRYNDRFSVQKGTYIAFWQGYGYGMMNHIPRSILNLGQQALSISSSALCCMVFVPAFGLITGKYGTSDAVESAGASARAPGSFVSASVAGIFLVFITGEALMMIHAFHR
jgi:hypothetical protein